MSPMLRVGRQIFVRTTALYASFLVAASVLARIGDAELGAHQIAYQLFVFLALVLDAVAIAGQVIVARTLGAGDPEGAFAAALRMIAWSTALGLCFALVLAPLSYALPRAFTETPQPFARQPAAFAFVVVVHCTTSTESGPQMSRTPCRRSSSRSTARAASSVAVPSGRTSANATRQRPG